MRRPRAFRPGPLDGSRLEGRVVPSTIALSATGPVLITTTYSDGGKQTEIRTRTQSGTTTTTHETITERDGSVETITDVATANGNTTTYNESIVQPDGMTRTETGTNTVDGNVTTIHRTIQVPGSPNPETISGTAIKVGQTTTTNETVTETDGAVEHVTKTVVDRPRHVADATTTTTYADGLTATVKSTTTTRSI
jgi:hypothetical protein